MSRRHKPICSDGTVGSQGDRQGSSQQCNTVLGIGWFIHSLRLSILIITCCALKKRKWVLWMMRIWGHELKLGSSRFRKSKIKHSNRNRSRNHGELVSTIRTTWLVLCRRQNMDKILTAVHLRHEGPNIDQKEGYPNRENKGIYICHWEQVLYQGYEY